MHKVIGIIPARYESTRFPGKPLVDISGKTLIQRTYENAKRCETLDLVVVATDDERIAAEIRSFGGEVVITSKECPTGTERIAEALMQIGDAEIVVNVQGDEPTLEPDVIAKVVQVLQEDPESVMSTAVVKLKDEEKNDPHVVKCVMDKEGHALYFSRSPIPFSKSTYYKHLGIYGFRKDFLLHYSELEPTPLQQAEDLEQLKVLEHGYKIHVAIVESNAIGIDTPEDIEKLSL